MKIPPLAEKETKFLHRLIEQSNFRFDPLLLLGNVQMFSSHPWNSLESCHCQEIHA